MMDFPSSPTVGTIVTFPNGQSYRWNGGQWDIIAGGTNTDPYPFPVADMQIHSKVAGITAFNSKANGSGTDVVTVDSAGSVIAVAVAAKAATTPQMQWLDSTGLLRAQVFDDLTTNKLTVTTYNASAAAVASGEILNTGNSPANAAGYCKLANGFILNWGTGNANANGDLNINFAAAFPSSNYSITVTVNSGASVAVGNLWGASVCNMAGGSCSIQARNVASGGTVAALNGGQCRWLAIGM